MRKRYYLPALALLAPTLMVSSACDADPVEPEPVGQRAVLETIYGKMNGDSWYRRAPRKMPSSGPAEPFVATM